MEEGGLIGVPPGGWFRGVSALSTVPYLGTVPSTQYLALALVFGWRESRNTSCTDNVSSRLLGASALSNLVDGSP